MLRDAASAFRAQLEMISNVKAEARDMAKKLDSWENIARRAANKPHDD